MGETLIRSEVLRLRNWLILEIYSVQIDIRKAFGLFNWEVVHVIPDYFFSQLTNFSSIIFFAFPDIDSYLLSTCVNFSTAPPLMTFSLPPIIISPSTSTFDLG
jgi:hypothetical protein